jgi:MFS family permease
MENLIEKDKSIEERFRYAIDLAGNEGKFQKIIFTILVIASFISSLTVTITPFHKELPNYFCFNLQEFRDDNDYDIYKKNNNYKLFYDEDCIIKHCSNNPNFVNEKLTVLVADYSKLGNLVTELNIFCEIDSYFAVYSQYLFVGRLLGLIVFSYISDKYGRFQSFNIMVFSLLFCYLAFFFLKEKFLFFVIGMISNACMFLWNLVGLMSTEMMSERLYNLANSLISTAFSLTGIMNIIFMYVFSNWNVILISQIFIIIILLYLTKIYMIETTSFLLIEKRYDELAKTIEFISSKNNDNIKHKQVLNELEKIKHKLNINLKLTDDNLSIKEKNGLRNFIEIFRSALGPYLIIFNSFGNVLNIVQMIIPYTTSIFIYYGQLFFIEEIPGSIYFNLMLVFTAEVIFELLSGQLFLMMEKKTIITLSFLLSTLGCFVVYVFDNHVIKLAMLFLVTMCNAINFVAMSVFMSDNFEVSVKSTSSSLVSLLSNMYMMFSARIIYLFGSSYLAFGAFSLIATLNMIIIKDKKLNASGQSLH